MKKKLFMMVAIALLLVACGGNDTKVIEGAKGGNAEATKSESKEAKEETASNVTKRGYVFEYNGVSISMDEPAEPVIEALGEPASYFESPSCAFEGIDKVYTYNSFELDTYPTDDKDFVSCIIFKDDAITTPEGVCIGDSVSSVTSVYGDAEEESGMIVYEKDDMKLCFIVSGDKVISIEYRSKVLDE